MGLSILPCPHCGPIIAPQQHQEPPFMGKVHLFLKSTVNNKDFCPTHSFIIECNVLQFRPSTSLHTRQNLISRWKISNYYGQVIGHCMGMIFGSLFSLALQLLALSNLKSCNRLNTCHLYGSPWYSMLMSLGFHNNTRLC